MAERLKVRYVEGTPHVQSLEHGAAEERVGNQQHGGRR